MGQFEVEDPKLAEVKAILSRLQRMAPDDEAPTFAPPAARTTPPPPQTIPRFEIPRPPTPAPAVMPTGLTTASAENGGTNYFRTGAALAAGCASAVLMLFIGRMIWLPAGSEPARQVGSALPASVATVHARTETVVIPVAVPALPPATAVSPTATKPEATAVTAPIAPASLPTPAKGESMTLPKAQALIQRGEVNAGRSALLTMSPEATVEIAWALARSFDPTVVGAIANADAAADVEQATRWYRQWHALAIRQGLVADSISVDRIIRSMQR